MCTAIQTGELPRNQNQSSLEKKNVRMGLLMNFSYSQGGSKAGHNSLWCVFPNEIICRQQATMSSAFLRNIIIPLVYLFEECFNFMVVNYFHMQLELKCATPSFVLITTSMMKLNFFFLAGFFCFSKDQIVCGWFSFSPYCIERGRGDNCR